MKSKFIAAAFALPALLFGQTQEPEMADVMRSNGKIYVVVTVLSIVMLGIATYLFLLDKKISKLEKEVKK